MAPAPSVMYSWTVSTAQVKTTALFAKMKQILTPNPSKASANVKTHFGSIPPNASNAKNQFLTASTAVKMAKLVQNAKVPTKDRVLINPNANASNTNTKTKQASANPVISTKTVSNVCPKILTFA